MSPELITMFGIGFLGIVTIVLAIMNWIFLSSTTSKISRLEDQIEKKTIEFEALKKERLSNVTMVQEQSHSTDHTDSSYQNAGAPHIEIVRNVRGEGFENYNSHQQTDFNNHTPTIVPNTAFTEMAPSPELLVVQDEFPPTPSKPINAISLTLFSAMKKDTDFADAWKKLATLLPSTPKPHVTINFSNVMYLYEKEMVYLEKFRDIILKSGGTLSFVNCHPELKSTLYKYPLLSPYTK